MKRLSLSVSHHNLRPWQEEDFESEQHKKANKGSYIELQDTNERRNKGRADTSSLSQTAHCTVGRRERGAFAAKEWKGTLVNESRLQLRLGDVTIS